MLPRYWIEQFAAVRDGGMMTSADAAALIDYLEDLTVLKRSMFLHERSPRSAQVDRCSQGNRERPEGARIMTTYHCEACHKECTPVLRDVGPSADCCVEARLMMLDLWQECPRTIRTRRYAPAHPRRRTAN